MLSKANQNSTWRRLYGKPEDGKFKDVEIILRSFALLCNGENYNGSMNVFINRYAKEAMNYSAEEVAYLYDLFVSFLKACDELPRELFTTKNGELNAALFDSVFTVVSSESFKSKTLITQKLHQERIGALKDDPEFEDAITHSTAFMVVGRERNRLVHQNYVEAQINDTFEEIWVKYTKACDFVELITELLSS